jgi:hypothetical protein
VVLAQPEQRVGEQEVLDLVAPEVEDQRAPSRVRAAARVGVLVERGPVEARKRELVAREVRRHPVEDHADAVLVQAVDELAEVVRIAVGRHGREVARHLVAPRARERMGHHRQQLHVGEAHVVHVGRELVGELEVGERAILVRIAPPRAEVHLVDRDGAALMVARAALLVPVGVAPLVRGLMDDRRGERRRSVAKATGSAFKRISPSWVRISYLYRAPGPAPGMNSSQMPLAPRARIGCSRPSTS